MDTPQLNTLVFEVTNRCNERCVHCYIPATYRKQGTDFSYQNICRLIDEFKGIGGKNVIFTGGEALLHKDLINSICYAKSKGLWTALFSNFTKLTDSQIATLKNCGIDDIQVSIYGVKPEVHDSITGVKGSCIRTKDAIERALKAGLPVRLTCSLLKENYSTVCEILGYAKHLGIMISFEMNIIACSDATSNNLRHRLDMNELEEALESLMKYDPEYTRKMLRRRSIEYTNQEYDSFMNSPICEAARDMLYITSTGQYCVCPEWPIGKEHNSPGISLKEFWETNGQLKHIRSITESSFLQCSKCEALEYCVRCFARNLSETGDIMTPPQYACEFAFMAKKIIENNSYANTTE